MVARLIDGKAAAAALRARIGTAAAELKARQTIERCRKQFERDPNSTEASINLAWAILRAPVRLRDHERALQLAEKAGRLIWHSTSALLRTVRASGRRIGLEGWRPTSREGRKSFCGALESFGSSSP